MIPMGFPSAPTTRTSFALISSLINISFVLMFKHPHFCSLNKKHAKRDSPHDTETEDTHGASIRPYALKRHGESGDRPTSFPTYCTITAATCQDLFFFFSKNLFTPAALAKKTVFLRGTYDTNHDISVLDFSRLFCPFLSKILQTVSFCTKKSPKNRLFWIFTFFPRHDIIIKLSAAPTPQHHAQQSHDLCGVSIL